jgi:hypothetical protein
VAKVTGDRELALTALVTRAAARERATVSPFEALALERRVVASRFRGSTSAFRTALTESGASLAVARGILGDELRAREIAGRLAVGSVSSADVKRFRETFAPVLTREVTVSPAPSWLPEGRGVVLATSAPATVFSIASGHRVTVRTAEGAFVVEARGEATALATVSDGPARAAVVRELRAERRAVAFAEWTIRMQKAAESKLVCERDRLPELGVVTLSAFAPFLSLSEAEAARWMAARRG